jgi:hemerythrin superfamily protein
MATTKRKPAFPEPMEMLMEDHKKVQKLFKQFEKLHKQDGDEESKREIVEQCCMELKVHAEVEEQVFYPAAREALEEQDLVEEALVEHASAKDLIAKLEGMDGSEESYDATFTVLGEYVNHHVKEEEEEMFPKVKRAKLDWEALAEQMEQRKMQMQQQLGMVEDEGEEAEAATSGMRRTASRATSSTRRTAARK